MSTWAIVPCRMGSSRLPGKTMMPLAGRPALGHIIDRLRAVPSLDGVVVATTEKSEDDVIAAFASSCEVPVYRGSGEDVLARTLGAARQLEADVIVTVTGDCPLCDPDLVDDMILIFQSGPCDYCSNRLHGYCFPVGMDVEVFSTRALAAVDEIAYTPHDREHVTPCFYEHPELWDLHGVEPEPHEARPDLRLTLDTPEDYALISVLYDALYEWDHLFGLDDVLEYLDANPGLVKLNSGVEQKVLKPDPRFA